jgi:hypothetical protein
MSEAVGGGRAAPAGINQSRCARSSDASPRVLSVDAGAAAPSQRRIATAVDPIGQFTKTWLAAAFTVTDKVAANDDAASTTCQRIRQPWQERCGLGVMRPAQTRMATARRARHPAGTEAISKKSGGL